MDSKECSALLPGSGEGAVHPPLPAWPWEAPRLAAAGSPNSARRELGRPSWGRGWGEGPEAPGSRARTNGARKREFFPRGAAGGGQALQEPGVFVSLFLVLTAQRASALTGLQECYVPPWAEHSQVHADGQEGRKDALLAAGVERGLRASQGRWGN